MSGKRVVYQDWIVAIGRDPAMGPTADPGSASDPKSAIPGDSSELLGTHKDAEGESRGCLLVAEIKRQVNEAMGKLTEEEREFVVRYYFMGQGYHEMSERSHRAIHRLRALHSRAKRKLTSHLAAFVHSRFGVAAARPSSCPICNSRYRKQIDKLVSGRDLRQPWRGVIKLIRDRYGIEGLSRSLLIGHEKYHYLVD